VTLRENQQRSGHLRGVSKNTTKRTGRSDGHEQTQRSTINERALPGTKSRSENNTQRRRATSVGDGRGIVQRPVQGGVHVASASKVRRTQDQPSKLRSKPKL
jgi:hypothetical protein